MIEKNNNLLFIYNFLFIIKSIIKFINLLFKKIKLNIYTYKIGHTVYFKIFPSNNFIIKKNKLIII